ncbi:lysylphosphatidylglycerol synthase transmembrane domain-containing protein [Streptacidiphilus rugosus]|uniref:lysylphosphatidylglycerol synthase transmembrane domain-containing protein n=1 Tax=Streptacidiphilus rugosus TaxID=405783 RepID=UPI0005601119|nr:YbhN family protein [Streptacidiphilus rugosus]
MVALSPRPPWRLAAVAALSLTLPVVLAAVCVPGLRQGLGGLAHLSWNGLLLVPAAQAVSLVEAAQCRRALLEVGGAPVRLRTALGVAYVGTAVAGSVPVVGAGVGAACCYRRLTRRGLDAAVAGWALTMYAVLSSLAFALVMTVGAALSRRTDAILAGLTGAAVNALPMLALLGAVRRPGVRRLLDRALAAVRVPRRSAPASDSPGPARGCAATLARLAALRATPARQLRAFTHAVCACAADCLCLALALVVAGGSASWQTLPLAYCLARTAGSLGLTPGGVGIVETTLAATLVVGGTPLDAVLPGVLLWRVVSFWQVVVVGYALLGLDARAGRAARAAPAPTAAPEGPAAPALDQAG